MSRVPAVATPSQKTRSVRSRSLGVPVGCRWFLEQRRSPPIGRPAATTRRGCPGAAAARHSAVAGCASDARRPRCAPGRASRRSRHERAGWSATSNAFWWRRRSPSRSHTALLNRCRSTTQEPESPAPGRGRRREDRYQLPLSVTSRTTSETPAAHRQPVDVTADLDDVEQHLLQRRGDQRTAPAPARPRRRGSPARRRR